MVSYTLVRSGRRTLAIHITKDAAVEVRAPLRTPKTEIERFLASKEQWILSQLVKAQERANIRAGFSLSYGDSVTLRGIDYPIVERTGNRAGFNGECFYIPPGLTPEQVIGTVAQVYRGAAKHILTEKTAEYAARMNVKPQAVKINGAKTRWGSCSAKNGINYSWRLIMAEDDVIDYVVVHELAHIKEHNHSERFWAIVKSVIPDYRQRKERLKALQDKQFREKWD